MHIEYVVDRDRFFRFKLGGVLFDEVDRSSFDRRTVVMLANDRRDEGLRIALWAAYREYPEISVAPNDTHIVQ